MIINIGIGVISGLITFIVCEYILKPYLNQKINPKKVTNFFRSGPFLFVLAVLIAFILSASNQQLRMTLFGHGLGSSTVVRELENLYMSIPEMKDEIIKSSEGKLKEKDLINLCLQEKLYYLKLKQTGKYSYKQNNAKEAINFSGNHKVLYPNSQIYSETTYTNGERLDANFKAYYYNGVIRAEIITDKSQMNDTTKIVKYYYNNGKIWCEYRYHDNKHMTGIIYDKEGNILGKGKGLFLAILIPGYFEKIERQVYDVRYNPNTFYDYGL